MHELEARVLALETIVRKLVWEATSLWKDSPEAIIDGIVSSAIADIRDTPNLATDEIRKQAEAEVMTIIGDLAK